MDQKDKHSIRDDGRKTRTESGDSRGQQGQRDRSRDSESAGRPMQASQSQPGQQQPGQHKPGQQQAGQHQTAGQQQAGHSQPSRQEKAPTGQGSGNRSQQGGPDRDKDGQR